MASDSMIEMAQRRHTLTRMPRLVSFARLHPDKLGVVRSSMQAGEDGSVVTIDGTSHFAAHPLVSASILRAQDGADAGLTAAFGAAWEDFWHEAAFLSLLGDTSERLLQRCRATNQKAAAIAMAIETSCLRVRARIGPVSSEFPQLADAIRQICRDRLAIAA